MPQQPQIERRFVKGQQVKLRAAGAKPGIEGYGAVFNQQYDSGWFIETIKPGAFSRALEEKQDVRCCFNHDPSNLLGRTKNKTLTLAQDSTGLHYDCDLNPDTRIATDVHAMVDRGDLDGCSFSFVVRKCSWREETDDEGRTTNYRDIEDVDLFELGPVTFPAYEGTSVGARALSQWPDGIPAEIRSHVPALRENKPGEPIPGTPADPGDGGGNADRDADATTDPSVDADQDLEAMEDCGCRCRSCVGGDCDECDINMESCGDADRCDMRARSARSGHSGKRSDGKKTKRVDGEDLQAGSFLYVGDEEKTATWALPWKFDSDEKIKKHLRNALARFDQTKKIPSDKKAGVYKKLVAKCKEYGIHVSGSDAGSNSAEVISLEQAKARTETLRAQLTLHAVD